MSSWRKKSLKSAEWAPLQEAFAALLIATGAEQELAMFVSGRASDPTQTVFIIGPGIDAIEARSPGGWQDADRPTGYDLALLVGSADAWERFGVRNRA